MHSVHLHVHVNACTYDCILNHFVSDVSIQCSNASAILYSLPDSSLTASSSHSASGTRPFRSRLYTTEHLPSLRGGWFANDNQAGQWLQANLLQPYTIQAVATRGRQATHEYYITLYKLALSLTDSEFDVVQNGGRDRLFRGNSDQNTIVSHNISATQAQYARLIAQQWVGHIVVRWELYVCATNSKYKVKQGLHYPN